MARLLDGFPAERDLCIRRFARSYVRFLPLLSREDQTELFRRLNERLDEIEAADREQASELGETAPEP